MRYITSILALAVLFSASSYAAKEITHDQAAAHTKIGELSIAQSETPTVGHKGISKEVDKKCEALGGVKAEDCYYVVVHKTGNESGHKSIDVEVYKK